MTSELVAGVGMIMVDFEIIGSDVFVPWSTGVITGCVRRYESKAGAIIAYCGTGIECCSGIKIDDTDIEYDC